MCIPMAAVAAIMVAQKVVQSYGQVQAAKQAQTMIGQQRDEQHAEIEAQAATAAQERLKQTRAARARMRVAAGEAGITGVSTHDMSSDALFQQSYDVSLINKNANLEDRASATKAKIAYDNAR